jgi:hypothetical protein
MNLTTSAMGTAVGLSSNLSTGVMDRFRTLPIARSAVLAGRTFSDRLSAISCGSNVLIKWLMGWRPGNGIAGTLAGLGVAVLFAYAMSWFTACTGIVAPDPESAQGIGLVILFPVAFVSTCFAPSQGIPGVDAGDRRLGPGVGGGRRVPRAVREPEPAKLTDNFPAQHPVFTALTWSVVIVAVCVPLATSLLRRRTADCRGVTEQAATLSLATGVPCRGPFAATLRGARPCAVSRRCWRFRF